jgi:acetyl esterase/lipase
MNSVNATSTPLSLKQRMVLLAIRRGLTVARFLLPLFPNPKYSGSVKVQRYGPHPAETLQLIEPPSDAPVRPPVVYIHGGGWIAGNKELYTRSLSFLAHAGHPVFNLEYPLAPETPHPWMLLSLLKALRWIQDQHPTLEAVHLMGDSAGGNLVMMLGLFLKNPDLVQHLHAEPPPLPTLNCLSVTSLYGVLDRLSWLKHDFPACALMLESYGGKQAFEKSVGPELAITPMDLEFESFPPTFLVAASLDPLKESSDLFAERLRSKARATHQRAGRFQHKVYEGENHGFLFFSWKPNCVTLRQDILDFLEKS